MFKEPKVRVNQQIRAREVRVIDENGQQLGVMHPRDALRLAEERGLDLVEVAPNAQPPVCRIIDYGKYQYQMSKRLHEAKKHQKQVVVKEVKFRPKTDEHDYQFKKNHIVRFLNDGNKAKVSIIFRGREVTHTEIGRMMMDRLLNDLKDIAQVEKPPKLEGYALTAVLAPRRGKEAGAQAVSKPSEQSQTRKELIHGKGQDQQSSGQEV